MAIVYYPFTLATYTNYFIAPPKPRQCDIKATTKRVDRQPIATPKPPQCDSNATLMRPQSHLKATSKPHPSQNKARNPGESLDCSSIVPLLLAGFAARYPENHRWTQMNTDSAVWASALFWYGS